MSIYTRNVAIVMGLAPNKEDVSPQANARVLAVSSSIMNFTSGEHLFRPLLGADRDTYIDGYP